MTDLALMPFQHTGAEFLVSQRHVYLADEPGLGKTPQAIAACDLIHAKNIAVLCPAIARANWLREFDRWQIEGEGRSLIVESYDRAALRMDVRAHIEAMAPDVLILDEAHYLQSPTTKRTKAVFGLDSQSGLAAAAQRVMLLSGTPVPNNVLSLYPVLRSLWPQLLPDGARTMTGFRNRYTHFMHTRYGIKVLGNRNQAELRRILSHVMLRRTVAQVLPELPELVWSSQAVARGPVDNDTLDEALRAAAPDVNRLLHAEMRGGQDDPGAVSRMRRLVGEAKAEPAALLVAEELLTGAHQKVIVWAYHTNVIDTLAAKLAPFGAVVVDGRVPEKQRQSAIDRFQMDPECRVFIGQLRAANTAITLTAATRVVFAEVDWNPDNNTQAARRALRIGQTLPVFATMLSLAQSLDDDVVRVLERKQRMQYEVLAPAAAGAVADVYEDNFPDVGRPSPHTEFAACSL